jgi:hypothetical protein
MSKIVEVSKQKNKYARTWYNLHRQELQELHECVVCGKVCKIYCLNKHIKTKYHIKHMTLKQEADDVKQQLTEEIVELKRKLSVRNANINAIKK